MLGKVAQERDDLVGRRRHLCGERVIRIAVEPNQVCRLGAQLEDLADVGAVVPVGIARLIGCAGYPGAIEALTQVATVRVSNDRVVCGVIEGQQPALPVAFTRLARGASYDLRGQAVQLGFVANRQAPGILRILDVVFEGCLRGGQVPHNGLEPRLIVVGQVDSGQPKVAQGLVYDTQLRRAGVVVELFANRRVRSLQARVL